MNLLARRRALMAANGNGIDIISGTVTVVGTTLTIPIPDTYYFHAVLDPTKSCDDGDIRRIFRDGRGFVRQKGASLEVVNTTGDIPWPLSHDTTMISGSFNNKNTTGLAYDGDEWFYIAWKEE